MTLPRFLHWYRPQSRQNARLFLQSSELGLPHPLASVPLPPLVPGGGTRSLAGEGVEGSQFRRRVIWCSIHICTLWPPLGRSNLADSPLNTLTPLCLKFMKKLGKN
jgi:hypothetical protein